MKKNAKKWTALLLGLLAGCTGNPPANSNPVNNPGTSSSPDAITANRALNEDGKLYGVAHGLTNKQGEHDAFIYDWGIRWDLYEQLGRPAVKNLDDLADVLGRMKEICPTGDDGKPTYAASIWSAWDGNMAMYPKSLVSAYYGYDELGFGMYDSVTGDFYDCLDPNGPYVDALRFFNGLYREGLLDSDSMTQTYDEVMTKATKGNVLFSLMDYSGSTLFNTAEHVADNKIMLPLVPEDANVIVWGLSTGGDDRIWSIGTQQYMNTVNYTIIPTLSQYSEPERDAELELKWNQVKTAVVNGSWNAMYAKDDAEFDSIISKMKTDADAYGYQDCVEWCREQAQTKFSMQ